jgi:hypothetical protein
MSAGAALIIHETSLPVALRHSMRSSVIATNVQWRPSVNWTPFSFACTGMTLGNCGRVDRRRVRGFVVVVGVGASSLTHDTEGAEVGVGGIGKSHTGRLAAAQVGHDGFGVALPGQDDRDPGRVGTDHLS